MSSFCTKCGNALTTDSAFCSFCTPETAETAAIDPKLQPHKWMQDDEPAREHVPQEKSAVQPFPAAANTEQTTRPGHPLTGGYWPPYKKWRPLHAAFASLCIPGLGQFYKGHKIRALIWLVLVIAAYLIFGWPAILLHLMCIVFAASGDPYER